MKIEELRIGNWVNFCNKSAQVTDLSSGFINDELPTYFTPIPLTPEILEKAGFKLDNNGVYWTTAPMGWIGFTNKGEIQCVVVSEDKEDAILSVMPHVKHLHTLQNLYFCLCGSELTIHSL